MHLSFLVLATLAVTTAACKKPEAPPQADGASAAAGQPATNLLKGKVLEKIEAPPYSYLKLATASGETWTAVPQTPLAVGAEATVTNAFPMKDFESKTINRKFEVVFFGTLEGAGGSAPMAPPPAAAAAPAMGGEPAANPAQMAAQHKSVASGPSDIKVKKVPKASGPDGRTVEEIWAKKAELKGKPVAVQGQVVKFSPGIMGRNWVHLRDGTGTPEKSNDDLTVTTQDQVVVGDVVTAKGTVSLDRDFGAGYAYPVIVEEAKVGK